MLETFAVIGIIFILNARDKACQCKINPSQANCFNVIRCSVLDILEIDIVYLIAFIVLLTLGIIEASKLSVAYYSSIS